MITWTETMQAHAAQYADKKQNNTIITSHWHTNQELHSMQAEDFAPSTYILLSNFPVSSDQNITNFNSLAVALDYKFK